MASNDIADTAIAKCKLLGSKGERLACLRQALSTLMTGRVADAMVQREVKRLELAIVATESDLG